MTARVCLLAFICASLVGSFAQGQELTDLGKELGVKIEVLAEGLHNPCGVAIRPGGDDGPAQVYVADSGHYRVIRVAADAPNEIHEVITEFPKDTYGKGPFYNIGPLGLVFLDADTLVVGGGGQPDGQELLRVYKLPDGDDAIAADAMEQSVGPIEPGDTSKQGEGNFYALASDGQAVYVASNGDDTKGWVLRSKIEEGKLQGLTGFIATKEVTEVDAPVGITVNPKNYIVVGQMGEITVPGDSLLTFYSGENGEMKLNLETGLFDITALAYSQGGEDRAYAKLYALDFAWMEAGEGGLFRLQYVVGEGKQSVEAVKIASLMKPTSMAFGPDGALYVTVFGDTPGDSDPSASTEDEAAGEEENGSTEDEDSEEKEEEESESDEEEEADEDSEEDHSQTDTGKLLRITGDF